MNAQEFKNFVIFSFPEIITHLNKEGKEKKQLIFNGVKWKNITETKTHWSHQAYAVICGKLSDISVIDFDDISVYNQLLIKYPFFKKCFKVKTFNGLHLYFKYSSDINSTTNALINYPCVDVRNDNSIVIIPPSKYTRLNGECFEYQYLGGDLFDIPTEFLKEFKQFNKAPKTKVIKHRCIVSESDESEDSEENEPTKTIINKAKTQQQVNNNSPLTNEIKEMLNKLSFDVCNNYDEWLKVGFIIFNELGSNGYELFNEWSKTSPKYNEEDVYNKYHSFTEKKDGLTIKTLKMMISPATKTDNDKYDVLINFNTGNFANYFKSNYGDKFIYCNDVLYFYNGVYWKQGDKKASHLNNFLDEVLYFELLLLFQEYEMKEVKKEIDNKKELFKVLQEIRKQLEKLRNHSQRENYLNDIICKITDNSIKWNMKPNLFCFENKLFDINTSSFVEPLPEYYINLTCGYNYDDKYDVSNVAELDKLINTIHTAKDIKDVYLTCLSTGLSGQTLENFIIANGSGGNGKGLLNELALETFGNYGYVMPSTILLNPLKEGSNPELANANFKRFVVVREPDDRFKINCATIKEITGCNQINARLNHSNDTKTNLNLTLVIECNEKPLLSEVKDAIERRVIDIPFNSIFKSKEVYDKLDEDEKQNIFIGSNYYKTVEFRMKYKQALFMILSKYYNKYYNNSCQLSLPECIIERNNKYMQASDMIFDIIDTLYERTDNKKDIVKLKELYEVFKNSDIYCNMSKEDKKTLIYKNFVNKLENSIFLKKFVKEDKSKVKILVCYKEREPEEA